MQYVIKSKLEQIVDGDFTQYIFKYLDNTNDDVYFSCIRTPNWTFNKPMKIGDIGFLTCNIVYKGDKYTKNGKECSYKQDACYFKDFNKIEEEKEHVEFKFEL